MPATNQKKNQSVNVKLFLATRKYLLGAVLVGVCICLLFFMVDFPKIQSLQQNIQVLNDEQAKLDRLQEKDTFLTNIQSVDLYAQRESIQAVLPSSKPVLPIIHRYEQAARESGIIVSEFEFKPGEIATQSADLRRQSTAAKQKIVEILDVDLKLVGEINNINTFLSRLEKVAPLSDFDSIRLTQVSRRGVVPGQPADTIKVFEVEITFSTYYYVATPQARLEQKLPDISVLSQQVLGELQGFQISTSDNENLPQNVPGQSGGKPNLFE